VFEAAPPLEPYRVLFPLGVLAGLAGVGAWPLHAFLGAPWPGPLHRALMMQGFEHGFVLGFLLTAIPGLTRGERCRPIERWLAVALLGAGIAASFGGFVVAAQVAFALSLVLVAVAAARRIARAPIAPPEEFVFIGLALVMGFAGAAWQAGEALGWPLPWGAARFGERLVSLGMVLSLVLGVGTLLVPVFAQIRDPLVIPGIAGPHERPGRRALYAAVIAALAGAFALEAAGLGRLGMFVRALAATGMVGWVWKLWRRPGRSTVPAWSMWTAGWMVPVGLAFAAAWPVHALAGLHVTFIGGFGLLTIAIGTRVVIAHGRFPISDEPLTLDPQVASGLGIALALRVAAEFDPSRLTPWLGASGLAWFVAWALWTTRVSGRILRPNSAGAAPHRS
jgi:uncharacterized protein involved in response to NO